MLLLAVQSSQVLAGPTQQLQACNFQVPKDDARVAEPTRILPTASAWPHALVLLLLTSGNAIRLCAMDPAAGDSKAGNQQEYKGPLRPGPPDGRPHAM